MEREKLIELFMEHDSKHQTFCNSCLCDEPELFMSKLLDLADHLIANGVTVREKGHFIFHEDMFGTVAECSCCHVHGMLYGNFCVHCGADMRGDKNV